MEVSISEQALTLTPDKPAATFLYPDTAETLRVISPGTERHLSVCAHLLQKLQTGPFEDCIRPARSQNCVLSARMRYDADQPNYLSTVQIIAIRSYGQMQMQSGSAVLTVIVVQTVDVDEQPRSIQRTCN